MFLTSDLERLRTKSEMREYFEFVYSQTAKNDELKKQARLHAGFYKKLLEEFYPLYCYSQSHYCEENARVAIVCGNQGFDAIKEFGNGEKIRLEFTEFFDGKREHEDAVLLNKRGMGIVHVGNPTDHKEVFIRSFQSNARRKSDKDYSDCILIFAISIDKVLGIFRDDTDEFLERIQGILQRLSFNASEVLLLVYNEDTVSNIDNNIYKIL